MTAARDWRGYVFIATSLDGYIARSNGDIDWLTDPPDSQIHYPSSTPADTGSKEGPMDYAAFMDSVDHLVMGRGTYEKVLTFDPWPYSGVRVIVISTTLTHGSDDRVTVTRSTEETAAVLTARGACGVYVDGGATIREFLRRDLIDELTITRVPVLLGSGLPLFGDHTADIHLTHRGTVSADNGMTTTLYHVVR